MLKFTHITDTHFSSGSNVRTGDYVSDLIEKLNWVVEHTNKEDATLLHSGDFFDKPTVPDFVKARVIRSLSKLKRPMYVIPGNHDCLFGDYYTRQEQTSLNLLVEAGVAVILKTIELPDVVLTSDLPLVDRGKKQICLAHGFLNTTDKWNINFQDIDTDDECVVLLGHDHMIYEPLTYRNTTIYRQGSFSRAIRADTSDRIPVMLSITVDKHIKVIERSITVAKSVELVFQNKVSMVRKSEVTYEDLVDRIKNMNFDEDSLLKVLPQVTDEQTVSYISNILSLI